MTQKVYTDIMAYLRKAIKGSLYEGHVFAVGGCERDKRLGNEIKDIDLVVDLPSGGIRFANWLHKEGLTVWSPVVYEHFGTAMFCLKEFPDIELETVQTRKECYHDMESRNPETAYGTIMDDCTRRDFTVNAFYYNISEKKELDLNGNSENDLKAKIIRTCGDPDIIFTEDPLRVLRMVRFAARLGFDVEEKTMECAKKYVYRLSIISRERIHDEFLKMCEVGHFDKFKRAMCLLWDLGAFYHILPSLGMLQNEGRFDLLLKIKGVWGVNYCPDAERLFAAMLYDCPEPESEMKELKCPNDFVGEVMFYIRNAKSFAKCFENEDEYQADEEFIFRKYAYISKNRSRLQAILSVGDYVIREYFFQIPLLSETKTNTFTDLCEENSKYFHYQLPVDGYDIMDMAGIKPGPKVKEILDHLYKFAFANPDHCDKDNILNYLKYIIENK